MEHTTKYLLFREAAGTGKTRRFNVLNRRGGFALGTISWYAGWRQYTFFPEPDMVFNGECLGDIQAYLERLMQEHANAKRAKQPA